MAKVTIAEVAQKAGVSKSAISHFFNDRSKHLGEATRKKILKVVEETDYRPNYLARSLRTKSTRNIGVLIPSLTSADCINFEIESVVNIAWIHGYSLIINCTQGNDITEEMYFNELKNRGVEGIIMVAPSHPIRDISFIQKAIDNHFPFVSIDEFPALNCSFCGVDRLEGGKIAANHLAAMGHETVLYLHGSYKIFRAQQRFSGFMEGWKANGLNPQAVKAIEIDDIWNEQDRLKQALKCAIASQPRPTAIFSTDTVALIAMKAVLSMGLRIPEDVSILGYDNLNWTEHLTPALTTIDYPKKEVGEQAFNILLKQIQNSGKALIQKRIKPFLVIRESCSFVN